MDANGETFRASNLSTNLLSRAVVLERFGEPLALRTLAVPPAPRHGLVVACHYGGICGTDLHLQQGHLDVPTPLVLGHEGLGAVHELGTELDRDSHGVPLRPGDVVMWASSIACGRCAPCRQYREPTLCEHRRTYGVNRPIARTPGALPDEAPDETSGEGAGETSGLSGSWAEHIVLREGTTVVRLPDGTDPLAAMSLACAGPTMIHAFYERRAVRVGETVVVQGSGPVGLAAAALAQLSGAGKVILVGGPEYRLKAAAAAGIGDEHVNIVDAEDPQPVLERVLAATGGGGADLVVECTGVPAAIDQGLRLARRGGSYLVIGQYTDSGDTLINPHQIVYRQLDVVGSWAFTGAHLMEYVRLLPMLTARFQLKNLVNVFALTEWDAALAAVARGSVIKAVLGSVADSG